MTNGELYNILYRLVKNEKDRGSLYHYLKGIGDISKLNTNNKNSLVNAVNEILDNIGNLESLSTEDKASIVNAINELVDRIGDIKPSVKITYNELKELRNNSQLVPGLQYRITDYHCTTTQENTQSADHQFDIIVIADDEKTLNENARAINHLETVDCIYHSYANIAYIRDSSIDGTASQEYYFGWSTTSLSAVTYVWTKSEHPAIGEEITISGGYVTPPVITQVGTIEVEADYFSKCNLAAWELKYCLDNDTNRFAWASKVITGFSITAISGFLYWHFIRNSELDTEHDGEQYYAWNDVDGVGYGTVYTKSSTPLLYDKFYNISFDEVPNYTIDVINEGEDPNAKGVIYYMKDEWNNECPYDFKNIQFYRKWNSTKAMWCDDGTSDDGVAAYTFSSIGNKGSITSFKDYSLSGSYYIYSNVIKEYISSKKQKLNNNCFFGKKCYNNRFGNNCYGNTFNEGCSSNTFNEGCSSNTFDEGCSSNTFGNGCSTNTFNGYCTANTFGNGCSTNTFGNECRSNTFGKGCSSNTFASNSDGTAGNYFYYNILENGVQYCILYNTSSASSYQLVKNYYIKSSIVGTYSSKKLIEATRNLSYDITVALNISGVLKIYCEADLIN